MDNSTCDTCKFGHLGHVINTTKILCDTPRVELKMSAERDILTVLNRKKEGSKMLNLSYTVEKDGSLVSISDRLMLSESMINDLMDSLVANGFDVVEMEVK